MLIITEKPSVAKDFAHALSLTFKTDDGYYSGNGITVTNCIGHLLETAPPEFYNERFTKWTLADLPIIPENIEYLPIERSKKQLKIVHKAIKKAVEEKDEIVIATDPDREGEVIARLVLKHCHAENYGKITRFWTTDILNTKTVQGGIEKRKPLKETDNLAHKGLAFKEADWVYGINMSRMMSVTMKKTISIGRVQTALLKELYNREVERKLFISKKYTELHVESEQGINFVAVKDGKVWKAEREGEQKEQEEAFKKIHTIPALRITDSQKKEITENPPQLFNQSALQKEAFKRYKISLDETLNICQELYEKEKVISYPRTESRVVGNKDMEKLEELFNLFNESVPGTEGRKKERVSEENKRVCNTEKVVGHHALLPLAKATGLEGKKKYIYDLIVERFLVQYEQSYKAELVELTAIGAGTPFKGRVRTVLERGWKKASKEKEEGISEIEGEVKSLQIIKRRERKEKKTESPKKYTQETLLSFMLNPTNKKSDEKLFSLGTEATRASYIPLLKDRKYVEEVKGELEITELGIEVIEKAELLPSLKKMIGAEETTQWEQMVEENPRSMYQKTIQVVENILTERKENPQMETEIESLGMCPACDGKIREGAKNFYCDTCKNQDGYSNVTIGKLIHGVEIKKELVKELLIKKETPFFSGVNGEGNAVSFKIIVQDNQIRLAYDDRKEAVGECPLCKKAIYEGKKNYYCEGYKDGCEFKLWKETSGVVFSKEDIKTLLKEKILENMIGINKEKKEYKCKIELKENGELKKVIYGGQ